MGLTFVRVASRAAQVLAGSEGRSIIGERGTGARRSACARSPSCLLPTRAQRRAFGSRLLVSQDLSAAWWWWWHMESGTNGVDFAALSLWCIPL